MHNIQQLRLMQLASSALPVGSFTWSQGLEWAVEIGWVKSADDFSDWQIQQMEQNFFTVDLPLLARLYRACEQDDLAAARRWSAYLLACRETRELRDEERSRARRLRGWSPTGKQIARGSGARSLSTANSAVWPGWACAGKSP
ncbi:urease accessory protein UreF [Citrobacter braakii]|nr:urease accessory protein UreF [Citrobacter braakii]